MLYLEERQLVYVTETIYDRETGLPVFQRTLLNGEQHTPPDGSPSEIGFDHLGRPERLEWREHGRRHRLNGPASIRINPENGVHVVESFLIEGKPRDPRFGPSRIVRDRHTGQIREQTFVDCNNPDQPAPC